MIELVLYDPSWHNLFAIEKNHLERALTGVIVSIEHIGSTAIPGIYAKPVIDILIGVKNLSQFGSADIKKITNLGYEYIQAYEQNLPFRRYFEKKDTNGKPIFHIHLVNFQSAWWQRHILFRDYLRKNPAQADAYANHKQVLAKQFNDTNQYALAKNEFCRAIDKLAYFDFTVHRPVVATARLYGYIPQSPCLDIYQRMFQDPEFVRCFGVKLSDDYIKQIINRDCNYWDQYAFGPYVWFDKNDHTFVGEGGLNHTQVEGKAEIELTYSLIPSCWGKGIAGEIGQFAIQDAFNRLELDNIVCFTMTTNNQSLRVIEKLGFFYEKDFIHHNLPHKLYRMTNSRK